MIIEHTDYREASLDSPVDLFIIDPPYGGIVDDQYDQITEAETYHELVDVAKYAEKHCKPGATCYIFGGIGKKGNRPLFKFLYDIEQISDWNIHNILTWKKRRGYGTQRNYMFVREEICMLVLGEKYPAYFQVQHTGEERDEAWKKRVEKQKYKPKSSQYRVSNVWTHINELFRKKRCTAEKPVGLYRTLIRASCPPDGLVFDPMCGSGTTIEACLEENRDFYCCEQDFGMFSIARERGLSWKK